MVSTALRSSSVQFTEPVATVLIFLPGVGVEDSAAAQLGHKVEPSTWPYDGAEQWPESERVVGPVGPVGTVGALVRVPESPCFPPVLVALVPPEKLRCWSGRSSSGRSDVR